MVPGMKVLPYKEHLRQLGLWTVEERRNRADLIEMFKMLRGKSSPNFDSLFQRSKNLSTRGHIVKLMKHHCSYGSEEIFLFGMGHRQMEYMLTEDCLFMCNQ